MMGRKDGRTNLVATNASASIIFPLIVQNNMRVSPKHLHRSLGGGELVKWILEAQAIY